ncbi:MAG: hypothetical protein Q7K55_04315 [Candidatus Levybacteria bacterium]|nr:hypothetical protein [Candidatus Levybacteria bacterium]
MRRKKIPLWLLILSILSFGALIYLIFFLSPSDKFFTTSFDLSTIYIFLICSFLFIFSSVAYLLRNIKRGIFSGTFVALYLTLRLNHLDQSFFLIILIALFVTIDLFFSRQNKI